MDVVGKNEEIVLRKSEKKKHKRNKEKEALSSSEVPTEKKKHKKSNEIEAMSSSEVPTEKKKHKRNKEKEAMSSSEVPAEKKKKHRRNTEKEAFSSSEVPEDVGGEKIGNGSDEKEGVSDNGGEENSKRKKKRDKEMVTECSGVECATAQVASIGKDCIDVSDEENNEHVKRGKGNKNKRKNANGGDSGESRIEESGGEDQSGSRSSKKRNRKEEVLDEVLGEGKKKKKKRTKLDADIRNANANIGDVETENNFGSTNEHLRNLDSKKSSKRVKFASHVEVFPPPDDKDDLEETLENKLVRGKRFTRKEDQIIQDAVHKYIEVHELGEDGVDMILNCRKHPRLRGCWKEIGAALPYRPWEAVYQRGHTIFERAETRSWTEDEKAFILRFHEKHGPLWKSMADVLGKNRYHVKDTWRRIHRAGLVKGKWCQAEYQSLFNLVNKDLRMHVYEEKKTKHGMIRDNISWKAVGNRLATRTDMDCCLKWYKQLSSSMVQEGKWADTDDYRLLDELLRLDACCVEDVDWDNLLEHRSGDITLKRWRQMVNHIGTHGLQSFAEQVEVLAERYCPELLEVREGLDSRPVVD